MARILSAHVVTSGLYDREETGRTHSRKISFKCVCVCVRVCGVDVDVAGLQVSSREDALLH